MRKTLAPVIIVLLSSYGFGAFAAQENHEAALKNACSVVYKNSDGDVYQLPTDTYMPVCKCTAGFINLWAKSMMSGMMMSSGPDSSDLLSEKERASCSYQNQTVTESISKKNYLGKKLTSADGDIFLSMSSPEVPANELFGSFLVMDDNILLISSGMTELKGIKTKGLSLFSVPTMLNMYQQFEDKLKEEAAYKEAPEAKERQRQFEQESIALLNKRMIENRKICTPLYKNNAGDIFRLNNDYIPACDAQFIFENATRSNVRLTKEQAGEFSNLNNRFNEALNKNQILGQKLDITRDSDFTFPLASSKIPANKIIAADLWQAKRNAYFFSSVDKLGTTGQSAELPIKPNANGHLFYVVENTVNNYLKEEAVRAEYNSK